MNRVFARTTGVIGMLCCKGFRYVFVSAILLLAVRSGIVYCEEDGVDQPASRIDFGNTYIQGQSIKSGAVYLTNRRKSALKSLLKTRESYRQEIVNDFYGRDMELEDSSLEPKTDPELNSSK